MDEAVARSMARWPNVPAVYGWLSLDRRGNWRIKGERIGNAALRDFIARNYLADERGCWFFQNGPQRVFVELAYTPLVVHYEGDALTAILSGLRIAPMPCRALPARRLRAGSDSSWNRARRGRNSREFVALASNPPYNPPSFLAPGRLLCVIDSRPVCFWKS